MSVVEKWRGVLPEHPVQPPQVVGNGVWVATESHLYLLMAGEARRQLGLGQGGVRGMVALPDGQLAVTVGSEDLLAGQGAVWLLDGLGQVVWRWQAGTPHLSAPLLVDGGIYVVLGSGKLVVLTKAGGAVRFEMALPEMPLSEAAPLVDEGMVYMPTRGPQLVALGLNGAVRWRFEGVSVKSWLDRTPLLVGDQLVLVDRGVGEVIAVDKVTGARRWAYRVKLASRLTETPLASDGRRLFVAAVDGIHALAVLGGRLMWHYGTARRLRSRPVVRDGYLFVTGYDRSLHVLVAETGALVARYAVARRLEVGAAVVALLTGITWQVVLADRGGGITAVTVQRPIELVRLRDNILRTFDSNELRDLIFELGVRYDDVVGERLTDRVRALVEMMARDDRLPDLLELCRNMRPNLKW